jgi:tRNA threonylcarbamoyladenosine biosynthesis protein TsaB
MACLALETSGMVCGVSVVSRQSILGEVVISSRETYSRRLFGSILWLLDQLKLEWDEIELIAVSLGPGSFTGLRIGISAAKGFCLARDIPIFGISTLEVLAENADPKDTRIVCPVMDARRGQIYTALFESKDNELHCITDYLTISPGELLHLVPEDREVLFLGCGLSIHKGYLDRLFGKRAVFAPEYLWYPRPAVLGIVSESRMSRGEEPADPYTLVPVYCRLSDAEEKRRARQVAHKASAGIFCNNQEV